MNSVAKFFFVCFLVCMGIVYALWINQKLVSLESNYATLKENLEALTDYVDKEFEKRPLIDYEDK